MSVNLIVEITSQYILISNDHIVHFIYNFIFQLYPVNLENQSVGLRLMREEENLSKSK